MPIRDNLSHLDICGNFLTEFPLQITCLKNLQSLNVSRNKIKFLPKELGTLPHLMYLDLTSNHLGKSDHNTWEWLEQTEVRNKLSELYLSDNLLTELPPQIGKLNALTHLKLVCNNLKCLPQNLANLKKLSILDLSDNDLLYLPGSVAYLRVHINVDGNPFNLDDDSDDDLPTMSTSFEVLSLMEYSADVILKSGWNYTNVLYKRNKVLVRYLDDKRYCFLCETPCFRYYEKRFINFYEYVSMLNVKFSVSENISNAWFECYACSSECAEIIADMDLRRHD
nr:PREDICTED: p53-induced death domain-containing protein 1-like [Linepithema humile]